MDFPHRTTSPVLTARHAPLGELVQILRAQQGARLDVVARAADLHASDGNLIIGGAGEPILTFDGVTSADVTLRPTRLADAAIADKLTIPTAYLRQLREQKIGLYDANVNVWLDHDPERRFLLRGLLDAAAPGEGVLRALLSDSYRIVDNLDVLTAAFDGIHRAGDQLGITTSDLITTADLSESRMYVKVGCPQIAEYAPELLHRYISPFTGDRGADNPTVFAGFVISNSEVEHGSFSITPQLTVQICGNGMTLTRHVMREVHLGGRLPAGQITWSADTERAALELVAKQARDGVTTFLDRSFVRARLAEIQHESGVRITQPTATLVHVAAQLRYSSEVQDKVLNHFVSGADGTSGGVLHAVTATAQTLPDADAAYDLERTGLRAMRLAAAHAA